MTELHTHEQDYANLYITLTSIIVIASIDKPDQYRVQMEFWTHQREAERWKLKMWRRNNEEMKWEILEIFKF